MLPRIRAVAGLVVAVAAAGTVTRADEHAMPASLDETTFLQRVREHSPRVRTFEARGRAASASVGVAGALPNPTLSYEREAIPGLDTSDDFVRLSWSLDVAGRRGLAVGAARAGADAERHDAAREAHLFESDARLAYLDAVYAREKLAQLDAGRAGLALLVDTLSSRARLGDTSAYDADRAALELDTLDDDRATARRALERARLRLGATLGEPTTPYDASAPLTLPAKPGHVVATQRSDVAAARARATRADRELRAAHRRWIPRFELVAGMIASTSVGGDGIGYLVGIGGDLPVFDRGGAAAERAAADAKRWRAEAHALENDARGDREQARTELGLVIEQAESYRAGPAARASDLERRAAAAYREGDRPILELLDVQRSARHAGMRALELVYEARRAELALQRAQGRI